MRGNLLAAIYLSLVLSLLFGSAIQSDAGQINAGGGLEPSSNPKDLEIRALSTVSRGAEPHLWELEQKVDLQALSVLHEEGKVNVIVFLRDAEPVSEAIAVHGLSSQAVSERKAKYSSMQDTIISSVSDFQPKAKYKYFNGFAGEVTQAQLDELQRNPNVEKVIYDYPVHSFLTQAVPLQNATPSYNLFVNGQNITGRGQAVCVLDTGIAYNHESFGSCSAANFFAGDCNKIPGGWNFINNSNNPYDDNGHGSHVSGIIAANGSVRGVAPDAKIVTMKVLNSAGSGSFANVILGVERCLDNKTVFNISVISMSLGDYGNYTNATCPDNGLGSDLAAAKNAGIAIFAASGNEGNYSGISSPACDPSVISVGASNKSDLVEGFTNTGSNLDLLAVGVSVTSVYYTGGSASESGTSMATPMAAGAAALMKQFISLQGGNATPAQIETALKTTGKNITDPDNSLSFPRISALQALIYLDSIPPVSAFVSPAPSENITINGSSAIINITINENYSSALLEWNGINETLTNSTGTPSFYAYVNKTGLASGAYSYKAYVIDLNGNANKTETRNLTIDNYPIFNFSLLTPANNSAINTTSIKANITFSSATASLVLLEWNYSANVTMNGTYPNFGANISGLEDLNYTYKVYANSSGSALWNVSGTRNVRVDTIIPVPAFTDMSPGNNTISQNSTHIINITSSETLANATLFFNGTAYNMTNYTGIGWYQNVSSLSDGNYSYYALVRDFANNSNTTGAIRLYVQSADLNVTFISPTLANASNTSANSIIINFTISGLANNITLEWNFTTNESVTSTSNHYWANKSSLIDGNYTYKILANHSARGGFNISEERRIYIDTKYPNGSFSAPAPQNGSIQNATYAYINISANESLANATLNWNGTSYAMYGNQTAWYRNMTSLSDGNYSYFAYITDYANNTNTTETRTLYVDLTPPSFYRIIIWNITNESATATFNASEAVNATVYFGFSPSELLNTSNATDWASKMNITLAGLAPASTYYIRIKAADSAYNYVQSGNYSFTTAQVDEFNVSANSSYQVNATAANVTVIIATNDTLTGGVLNVSVSQISQNNLSSKGVSETGIAKFVFVNATSNITSALSSAILRIYYNQSEISALGITESSIRLFRYNTTNSSWAKYASSNGGVDTSSNFAWANTTSFSEWTAGGQVENGYSCAVNATCTSAFCNQTAFLCGDAPVETTGSNNQNTGGSTSGTSSSSGGGAPAGGGGSSSGSMSLGASSGEKTYYFIRKNTVDRAKGTTVFTLFLKNNDTEPLADFELLEEIPPSAANSTDKIEFGIAPDRFEHGSIIAVWKFQTLLPGESVELTYLIAGKVYKITDFKSSIRLLGNAAGQKLLIMAPASAGINGEVVVQALGEDGKPVANLPIRLVSPLGREEHLRTDGSGKIKFVPSYYGEYAYYISASSGTPAGKTSVISQSANPPSQPPEQAILSEISAQNGQEPAEESAMPKKPSAFSFAMLFAIFLALCGLIFIYFVKIRGKENKSGEFEKITGKTNKKEADPK